MKADKTYGYLIMSIKDEKEVVVDEAGEKFDKNMTQDENEIAYEKLKSKLLEGDKDPKYVLFDFKFETREGRRDKLVFLNWCSDNSNRKKKMLQGSSCEGVKKHFPGFAASVQANDDDELDYHTIRKDVMAGKK